MQLLLVDLSLLPSKTSRQMGHVSGDGGLSGTLSTMIERNSHDDQLC